MGHTGFQRYCFYIPSRFNHVPKQNPSFSDAACGERKGRVANVTRGSMHFQRAEAFNVANSAAQTSHVAPPRFEACAMFGNHKSELEGNEGNATKAMTRSNLEYDMVI